MLKLARRALAALITSASIHPVSRAATVNQAQVMTDAEAALKEVEYENMAQVRPEYLKNYAGEKTLLSGDLRERVLASKRWKNGCITARRETEEFVAARTREER